MVIVLFKTEIKPKIGCREVVPSEAELPVNQSERRESTLRVITVNNIIKTLVAQVRISLFFKNPWKSTIVEVMLF